MTHGILCLQKIGENEVELPGKAGTKTAGTSGSRRVANSYSVPDGHGLKVFTRSVPDGHGLKVFTRSVPDGHGLKVFTRSVPDQASKTELLKTRDA